jgi:hypothetical protein
MLINLLFVLVMGFLLLALVFVAQKQRLTRPAPRPVPAAAPPPGRPLVDLRPRDPAPVASSTMPESAISAVTTYTHDRATSERLLQCYRLTHGRGWGETADHVIRDLVRDRR